MPVGESILEDSVGVKEREEVESFLNAWAMQKERN